MRAPITLMPIMCRYVYCSWLPDRFLNHVDRTTKIVSYSNRATIHRASSSWPRVRCIRRAMISGACAGRAIRVPLSCWRAATRRAARNAINIGQMIRCPSITETSKFKYWTIVIIPIGSAPNSWCGAKRSNASYATSTSPRGQISVCRTRRRRWHDSCVPSVIASAPINGQLWCIAVPVSVDPAHSLPSIEFCSKFKCQTYVASCIPNLDGFYFLILAFFPFAVCGHFRHCLGHAERASVDGSNRTTIYLYLSMFVGCIGRQREYY